jgi:hypothetical protein
VTFTSARVGTTRIPPAIVKKMAKKDFIVPARAVQSDAIPRLARQKEQNFHHNVYVVLLRNTVAKHPSILRLNPKRDPLKPCVYVGMTGIPVDHRFENHRNGYKSAWVVRKYGVRLMPELYEHLNPMPFEAAVQMESELAEDLRAAGYTVTGGH